MKGMPRPHEVRILQRAASRVTEAKVSRVPTLTRVHLTPSQPKLGRLRQQRPAFLKMEAVRDTPQPGQPHPLRHHRERGPDRADPAQRRDRSAAAPPPPAAALRVLAACGAAYSRLGLNGLLNRRGVRRAGSRWGHNGGRKLGCQGRAGRGGRDICRRGKGRSSRKHTHSPQCFSKGVCQRIACRTIRGMHLQSLLHNGTKD